MPQMAKDEELVDVIKRLPKLGQRQYDTQSQLIYLMDAANKLGLYDAADAIRNYLSIV